MHDAFARWCVGDAGAYRSIEALLEGYALALRAAGLPVTRVNLPMRSLHPTVRVSAYSWTLAGGARAVDQLGYIDPGWTERFARSPFRLVYQEGVRHIRRRLVDPDCPRDFGILEDLRALGVTDYVVLAGDFHEDGVQAVTYATDHPDGFSEADVAALSASVAPFLLRVDLLYGRAVADTVTRTYLGERTGPRVLAGEIHRGAVTSLDAVVGFCDLRGFTARSAALEPVAVTEFLNAYFERVEAEASRTGGEILKFIGDAALIVWPIGDGPEAACEAALDTARGLPSRLSAETDLACGMALHRGEVAYGNIGGRARLDFTVIGAAVNLASRLESLTSRLGVPWAVSGAVARHVATPLRPLGTFELKGVPEPVEVFGPE